jgi:hypothetical protein
MKFKKCVQEEADGCGISCVASILNISYKKALRLFGKKPKHRQGYYCKEIINALKKKRKNYSYKKANKTTKRYLKVPGTIVFIKPSKKYPIGHYLLKTNKGWMNPWVNYPSMNPAKSGFEKKLPNSAQWIIFKNYI